MLETLGEFKVLLRLKIDFFWGGGDSLEDFVLALALWHKAEDKKAGTDGLQKSTDG